MENTARERKSTNLELLMDWLLHRGPGVVLLRLLDQLIRIILGRPLYRYAEILPGLYVGGQHRRHGWGNMKDQGITAVVNMRRFTDDIKKGVAPERYLHLPTTDNTPPTLDDLKRGVNFIEQEIEAGGEVYVHCGVGVGRAPTMAAAYLVSTGMTAAEAWWTIRKARPFIWPMKGQIAQIERFAEALRQDREAVISE